MVDFYTALKLLDMLDDDNECVYLRCPGDEPACRPSEILIVKQVKEKYDLRKTKVISIRPYFCCNEYEGMLLTLAYIEG